MTAAKSSGAAEGTGHTADAAATVDGLAHRRTIGTRPPTVPTVRALPTVPAVPAVARHDDDVLNPEA